MSEPEAGLDHKDGMLVTPGLSSESLWQKFYADFDDASSDLDIKYAKQLLSHLEAIRNRPKLPPFFAFLTGPTIVPYLVESRSVTLGRVSSRCKIVDVNLGDLSKISRHHCTIRFDLESRCFVAVNMSKNGIKVQHGEDWMEVLTEGDQIPLGNPATLYIQGIRVYFHVFYVVSPADLTPEDLSCMAEQGALELPIKSKRKLTSCYVESADGPASVAVAAPGLNGSATPQGQLPGAAARTGSGGSRTPGDEPAKKRARTYTPRANPGGEGLARGDMDSRPYTFSELIVQALNDLGGAATQASITSWIEANHPLQIQGRKTWKNSVSGVLSANSIFVRVPSEVKQRRPLWKLVEGATDS